MKLKIKYSRPDSTSFQDIREDTRNNFLRKMAQILHQSTPLSLLVFAAATVTTSASAATTPPTVASAVVTTEGINVFDSHLNYLLRIKEVVILLYLLVFVACLAGNLLVLTVIIYHRQMRNSVNFFLANLAVADLCVGVFCVLPNLFLIISQHWPLGRVMCKLLFFIRSINYSISIIILTVVCLERYFVIVNPILSRRFVDNIAIKVGLAGVVWLIGVGYSVPLLFSYDVVETSGEVFFKGGEELWTESSSLNGSKFWSSNNSFVGDGEMVDGLEDAASGKSFLSVRLESTERTNWSGNVDKRLLFNDSIQARGSERDDLSGQHFVVGVNGDKHERKTVPSGKVSQGGSGAVTPSILPSFEATGVSRDSATRFLIPEEMAFCVKSSNSNGYFIKVYILIDFLLLYITPLMFMSLVYFKISQVLWKSSRNILLQAGASPTKTRTGLTEGPQKGNFIRDHSLRSSARVCSTGKKYPQESSKVLKKCFRTENKSKELFIKRQDSQRRSSPFNANTNDSMCSNEVFAEEKSPRRASPTKATAAGKFGGVFRCCSGAKYKLKRKTGGRYSVYSKNYSYPGEETCMRTIVGSIAQTATSAADPGTSKVSSSRFQVATQVHSSAAKTYSSSSVRLGLTPGGGHGNPSIAARQKVIRLLIAMVVAFAVCMLPHHIRLITQEYLESEIFSKLQFYLTPFLSLLFYMNSAINPVLYSLLSRKFRKLLFSRCRRYKC